MIQGSLINKKNQFTILVSSFNYGGIEILIKRMSNILFTEFEVHVFLLTNKYDDSLVCELRKYATVHFPRNYLKLNFFADIAGCNSVLPIKKSYIDILNNSKYIHASDSHCIVFLTANIFPNNLVTGISVGNYQSEEYLWKSDYYFRKLELELFKNLNVKSIYSMNNISIEKLARAYGKSFSGSRLMPAGIELPNFNDLNLKKRKNQLVCVGRLVKFKSYIEYVIRDIPHILKEIPDFEFHIFGDGSERAYLERISKGLPVFFNGLIDISMLNETIREYKVFVGSGTSILTASALGVPSVIGIESVCESMTYGFLYETKGLDYQEDGLDYPRYTIHSKIIEALNATDTDYEYMCTQSRIRAKQFCITNSVDLLRQSIDVNNKLLSLNFIKRSRYFLSVFFWALINKLGISKSKVNRHYFDTNNN